MEESSTATDRIVTYLNSNEDFQEFLENYENSKLFQQFLNYVESWGYDASQLDLQGLRDRVTGLIAEAGQHANLFFNGVLSFISNLGSFITATIVFLSALLTMMQSHQQLEQMIAALSPFTGEDQEKLSKSFSQSVSRIFVCSAVIAAMHFGVTWFSFWLTGLDLRVSESLCSLTQNVFAAVSAFLATIPMLGTWLLWLPASGYLWLQGDWMGALVVALAHVAATYLIQPYVYSWIPGNPYYVSLSIVLGITTFGNSL